MSEKKTNAINLYMVGISDGRVLEAISEYTWAFYKQCSTVVWDGGEGFIGFSIRSLRTIKIEISAYFE